MDRAGTPPGRRRPELQFPGEYEPIYTVGQAAELLGVQPAFLRRLEAHEAVTPSRTAGGQRRYTRKELEHIDALTGLMSEGMTLAGAMRVVALQAELDELRLQLSVRSDADASGHGPQRPGRASRPA